MSSATPTPPNEQTKLIDSRQQSFVSERTDVEAGNNTDASLVPLPPPPPTTAAAEEISNRSMVLRGLLAMGISAFGSAVMAALVKASAKNSFPSLEIVFFRSVVQLIGGCIGAMMAGVNPLGPPSSEKPNVRWWLTLRGFGGALGVACHFTGITMLPLSDASVFFSTVPIMTALIAYFVLGEPYTLVDQIISVLCVLGVVLISKPASIFSTLPIVGSYYNIADASVTGGLLGGEQEDKVTKIWGACFSLAGAFCAATAYIIIRRIGKGVHYTVQVVHLGLHLTLVSVVAMYFSGQAVKIPTAFSEWAMLLSVGLTSVFLQMFLTVGLQLAPAGPATLVRNLDVVFSYIFSIVLFNEIPDFIGILGSILVVGCSLSLSLIRKARR
ncbi:hypothetical protein H4219_001345 [Mycoemilia scoparia]|uniref:EamA domain-containing protein n=1 Tax=Mycoemilia scoparia TaxID=417184 RepID=A0A9W8A3N0_9FUNG|nr:hypothetical protein H4219_001345 [Mycoemilia scoparia]